MLQWKTTHPRIQEKHKLDLMGLKKREKACKAEQVGKEGCVREGLGKGKIVSKQIVQTSKNKKVTTTGCPGEKFSTFVIYLVIYLVIRCLL